jgi:hypothetical protein
MLAVLPLGLLLILMGVFSSMRSGEEYGGEMRAKSLVYDADSYSKTGLYWMDDKANMRKATPEEFRSYEKLHPNEAIPVCQTTTTSKTRTSSRFLRHLALFTTLCTQWPHATRRVKTDADKGHSASFYHAVPVVLDESSLAGAYEE